MPTQRATYSVCDCVQHLNIQFIPFILRRRVINRRNTQFNLLRWRIRRCRLGRLQNTLPQILLFPRQCGETLEIRTVDLLHPERHYLNNSRKRAARAEWRELSQECRTFNQITFNTDHGPVFRLLTRNGLGDRFRANLDGDNRTSSVFRALFSAISGGRSPADGQAVQGQDILMYSVVAGQEHSPPALERPSGSQVCCCRPNCCGILSAGRWCRCDWVWI